MDNTQEWDEMTQGQDYNNRLNVYAKNELFWRFYNNDHWSGVKDNGLPKYTFPMCRSAIDYFVAYLCSQTLEIKYESDDPGTEGLIEGLNKAIKIKWEKDKMDQLLRECMLDGGVSGDYAAYVYWDANKGRKGDFVTEIIDGIDVLFGNPNNSKVEAQPYILILGRDIVKNLKEEAKANGIPEDEIRNIVPDEDTQYQTANGKIELNGKDDLGKCNYIIKYYKKDGKVYWNKSTRYCTIRKDVDLGISRYPIAWGNWAKIKNSYHGMGVIDGIIDNQIAINQLFAMISYWMKTNAFGKTIINSDRITSWSNKIGEVIKCDGDIRDAVYQMQAGNFNVAIIQVIELAIKLTKDFIGASDSLMGQVNPEQASGTAIMATGKSSAVPLGNPSASKDQFLEDLALIYGEFFVKKLGIVEDTDIILNVIVEVGPSDFYAEPAAKEDLKDLLKSGKITDLEYFERMKKFNTIPDCEGLIASREQAQQQPNAEQAKAFIESLPPEQQQQILSQPNSMETAMNMMASQGA